MFNLLPPVSMMREFVLARQRRARASLHHEWTTARDVAQLLFKGLGLILPNSMLVVLNDDESALTILPNNSVSDREWNSLVRYLGHFYRRVLPWCRRFDPVYVQGTCRALVLRF